MLTQDRQISVFVIGGLNYGSKDGHHAFSALIELASPVTKRPS